MHFGFLDVVGETASERPVVMTVPMAEDQNFIVGASLREFLALGCRFGYFALEQLAYNYRRTIAHIQSGTHACKEEPDGAKLLAAIRDRFELRPWPNVTERLKELELTYASAIVAKSQ